MRSQKVLLCVGMLVATVVACDKNGNGPVDPLGRASSTSGDSAGGGGGGGGGGNGGGNGGGSSGPDTTVNTPPVYTGLVKFSLQVRAATRVSQNGGDTLSFTPLAGASVQVLGLLQLSQATTATSDANGNVVFNDMIVGPYEVRVTPPAGSGVNAGTMQVLLNNSSVYSSITLFPPSH